jgi:hypothetical protein
METTAERFFPVSAGMLRIFGNPKFLRKVFTVFLCVALCTFVVGCSVAQVQTVVQQVLADLPTILNIVASVVAVVGVAKGLNAGQLSSLQATVSTFEAQAKGDLGVIQTILTAYQNGLANAPANIIAQLDSAVNAITSNLAALEAAFHVSNATTQASIGIVVAAVSAFLLGVTSLIPVSIMAEAPLMSSRLRSAGIAPGSGRYIVPTAHALARSFNEQIGKVCPRAKVHVPWVRVAHVPIWP